MILIYFNKSLQLHGFSEYHSTYHEIAMKFYYFAIFFCLVIAVKDEKKNLCDARN